MARTFAMVFGLIFLVVGVLGFVPQAMQPPPAGHEGLTMTQNHGMLLGLFHVNMVHNVVHILIGLWGLMSAGRFASAVTFCKGLAVVYALLAVLGLFPQTSMLFGMAPLEGNNVFLHAGVALLAAIVGWSAKEEAPTATA